MSKNCMLIVTPHKGRVYVLRADEGMSKKEAQRAASHQINDPEVLRVEIVQRVQEVNKYNP